LALGSAALSLLLFASVASASTTICATGSGAGQCQNPRGIATDFETGHLYVADTANNRVDVFATGGTFLSAFGWGVKTGANTLQSCTAASTCRAGIAGAGAGQFSSPSWIAVDNVAASASRHDVYVGTDNFRVQKFTPTGELLGSFGKQGTGPCEFARGEDPLGVGPSGNVYVADSFDKDGGGKEHIFVNRVIVFSPAGACLEELPLPLEGEFQSIKDLAIDSTGHIYVRVEASGHGIRKYSPTGVLEYTLDVAGETGGVKTEGLGSEGLTIDDADNLFVKQEAEHQIEGSTPYFFTEYSSTGLKLKRFGYLLINGAFLAPSLAFYHSAGGDLYASEGTAAGGGTKEVEYLQLPPPGPVVLPTPCKVKKGTLGNTKATLQALVNPEGTATTVHFEYIDDEGFVANGNSFSGPNKPNVGPEGEPTAADFELREASAQVELVPETKYHCRAVATNAEGSATGEEGTFTSLEPLEIGPTTVSGVGTETATLNAQVNPLGVPGTTGYFEYVEEATYEKDIAELGPEHGFDHAVKAPDPAEPLDFGTGESLALRSLALSGLKPGTSYRFRIVATDSKIKLKGIELPGPTASFRTFQTGAAVSDNRAYELVSPGEKNSAEVGTFGPGSGFFEDRSARIQAAAGSGESITYTSWTSFGAAEGAFAASQYLSKRTASGWATANTSPFGFVANPLFPPYIGFTPDLRYGAFKTTEPALTADCRKGSEDMYLRDNETGELRCLSPETPGGPEFACLIYAGASADASRVFVAGRPEGGKTFTYRLYELTAGGVQPIGILPGGELAPATEGTAFGPSASSSGTENCGVTRTRLNSAISRDGSKVFWTYAPADLSKPTQLFVRVNGEETIQLDAKQAGGTKANAGIFMTASADGSVAYFTDTGRLIAGSKANPGSGVEDPGEPDLYRYELGKAKPLTDLTKGAVAGNVQGVVGASEDGSYLYFVAKAALSGEEANARGQKAKEGANNLYLYHEDKPTFIATLSVEDRLDWSRNPRFLKARVSPDGKHLAFLSIEAQQLAGYDNARAEGEPCEYLLSENSAELVGSPLCAQAFLYDAESGELTCASCNPSGARPLGPAVLPGWINGFEGPRYLSDDGQRFFFESLDALTPGDENGKLDVYEFEQAGAGSCSEANPTFAPSSGGCLFAVSSGKSQDESFLIDASNDGRDVFLSTREQLTGWDVNENFDIYDYREGGGFPEPQSVPQCAGEAGCKPPPSSPPAFVAPPRIEGPGNSPAKAKKKRHKQKKSRHQQNHQSGHHKANPNGKTGR
jgi:hypothetical protein